MSLHRRRLLSLAAAAAPGLVAGKVWAAAPQTGVRLLVVFLRGGYDAANVVIPTASDFYYQARPTLHIARPDPTNPDAALPLDADWGLHPALKDSLYPLWKAGQVSFVPFAGCADDLTRSHFETQDTIELGQAVHGTRNYGSGFMSRLSTQLARTQPISFTDQLPLTFRGDHPIPNVGVSNVGKPAIDDRMAGLIQQMYVGQPLAPAVAQGFQVRNEVYRSVSAEMIAADRGAVSPKGFELSARRIGRLMRNEYDLGFVDIGGWDTHVNQGAAQGYLAGRLGELGRGLAGFAEEMGPEAWKSTVVVVVSEFGRTFRENGNGGTDHGHGGAYWLLGGGIKGGLVGEQTKVAEASLNQNRDFAVRTDYRAMLSGLFQRMYGLSPAQAQAVFPGATPLDLSLV